jgi:hypothetical protein
MFPVSREGVQFAPRQPSQKKGRGASLQSWRGLKRPKPKDGMHLDRHYIDKLYDEIMSERTSRSIIFFRVEKHSRRAERRESLFRRSNPSMQALEVRRVPFPKNSQVRAISCLFVSASRVSPSLRFKSFRDAVRLPEINTRLHLTENSQVKIHDTNNTAIDGEVRPDLKPDSRWHANEKDYEHARYLQ